MDMVNSAKDEARTARESAKEEARDAKAKAKADKANQLTKKAQEA